MGLYEDDNEEQVEQEYARNRMTGSYIAYHARKQLAFGWSWCSSALHDRMLIVVPSQTRGGLYLHCGSSASSR